MTEAVRSVIDRAFTDLPHIMRIASWADIRNEASWRVMQKVGLTREGVFRSCRVLRGERIDDVRYAILREQWVAAAGPLPR
jgi:RimJ/RimL family protein N-acetyltransferase